MRATLATVLISCMILKRIIFQYIIIYCVLFLFEAMHNCGQLSLGTERSTNFDEKYRRRRCVLIVNDLFQRHYTKVQYISVKNR